MFRRDGRLAGLGEWLGVIDILPVDERQHPGADTSEFDACVEQIHRGVDAVFLPLPGKDLCQVNKEVVLVVRVDVGHIVNEYVCEHVDVRVRL